MAIYLARPKQRLHSNPSLIHLFSTSSPFPQDGNGNGNDNDNESGEHSNTQQPPPPSSYSSYFSGIKSSLKQTQPQFSRLNDPLPSLRRNLNEFSRRAAAPPARDLQDLYHQNARSRDSSFANNRKVEAPNMESVRANLRDLRSKGNNNNNNNIESSGSRWPTNLASFKSIQSSNTNMRPIGGGSDRLPTSVFGKELEEKERERKEDETEFLKIYSTDELGEKLRMFRPEGKKEQGWFSLQELNQRLVKLRAMEEEARSKLCKTKIGATFLSLNPNLHGMEKTGISPGWGSILNGTPKYLLEPPKEELVDTYFHPDNMSSAEKMKIQLGKVREEFKMSESDCGSARVQVAQLTTKIKHLSSVLHKKDKHSRKGLLAMVQRRKKLLKYMRRTDWDSYCISLSKLGLRDNPDYKF